VGNVSQGQKIITIEGLGTLDNLSPLQKAFVDHTAFCCGFCTPGMIITAIALLARTPNPSREEPLNHSLKTSGEGSRNERIPPSVSQGDGGSGAFVRLPVRSGRKPSRKKL
jgi:hypothetical protein